MREFVGWMIFAAIAVGYIRMCIYPDNQSTWQRLIFWRRWR